MAVRGPDTRIPLMGIQPQAPDILGSMDRVARIKRLEAISQQEQQEMALKQKAAQEDEQFKQAMAQTGGDPEKVIPLLMQINPVRAMAYQKLILENQEATNKSADTARSRQEDEQFKAVMQETGGDWTVAKPRLMAINPKRTLEFEKLQREAQGTPQLVDVVVDGKLQKAWSDPSKREIAPTGILSGQSIDDTRADKQLAIAERSAASTERHQRVMEAKPTGTDNALVAIVGPDGKPVLVPRSQAVGKTPASTRDSGGGRGVTSGDAGRIADFDTSLNDLKTLRTEIAGNKATGAMAAAGAYLPNAVTEFTGIGADAKAKQALIDRVKQVIGKAFEGGVLRKEDEAKYAKILPTISDPTSLVVSKLNGLESSIKQRRSTLIDSLDDAGYNTDAYKSRAPKDTTPPQPGSKPRFEIISVK